MLNSWGTLILKFLYLIIDSVVFVIGSADADAWEEVVVVVAVAVVVLVTAPAVIDSCDLATSSGFNVPTSVSLASSGNKTHTHTHFQMFLTFAPSIISPSFTFFGLTSKVLVTL
jgi:hypothetical protein